MNVFFRERQFASGKPLPPGINWIGIYPTGEPFQPATWRDPAQRKGVPPAELWRGRYLLAPFSELPPLEQDQVYLHDLVGMRAVSTTGKELGQVTTFYELPQGIVLDVKTAKGSVLIPYSPESVIRTDLARRTIVFNQKSGLLD